MSTPPQQPRSSTKTQAKRRTAARKQRREFMQQAFAIFFVIIFVLGTATSAFVFTGQSVVAPADATATAVTSLQPTAAAAQSPIVPSELVQKGDDAVAQSKFTDALSYYQAAAALDQGNADLYFKIGSLLIQTGQYDSAADQLARAIELDQDGPVGVKAKALIEQNKDTLPTRVIGTGAPGVKGVITGTQTLPDTAPITNTNPVTNVIPSGAAPTATK